MDGGPGLRKIPADLGEAAAIQEAVARASEKVPPASLAGMRYIAGADASYSPDGRMVHAAVAVLDFPDLAVVDRCRVTGEVTFPYVPGFFAFREGPAILSAVGALARRPDLLLVDGHGRAHPRRAGIATHVGFILKIPTIGVAKRILTGEVREVGAARGSSSPILGNGEILGMAVRTREGSRPVCISPGHAVDPETAVRVILATTGSSRIPAPLREAHRLSREVGRRSSASPVTLTVRTMQDG